MFTNFKPGGAETIRVIVPFGNGFSPNSSVANETVDDTSTVVRVLESTALSVFSCLSESTTKNPVSGSMVAVAARSRGLPVSSSCRSVLIASASASRTAALFGGVSSGTRNTMPLTLTV